jgi:molybdenum cofactor cytidylyltransferase
MLIALIPAAGHSTRMGRPKLALPLGERTVLERVIEALRAGGVDHVVVVLGPHVKSLANQAETAGANVLVLPEATPDMRATIEAGLNHIEMTFHPMSSDAWLLCPADHPALDGKVISRLRKRFLQRLHCSIAIPMFEGKRGHPVIISWRHVAGIRAFSKDRGVNSYLRQFPNETLGVLVDSPFVLTDLDTPEDYERLLQRFTGIDLLG